MTVGHLYLLKSTLAPIYKIGKASEHRKEQRLRELDVGTKNELVACCRVWNYHDCEKDLHRIHKQYRIPQSEYFALPDHEVEKLAGFMEEWDFDGLEIESEEAGQYNYIRLTPYSEHLTLEDSDGEAVAIDKRILWKVIKAMENLHEVHYQVF
jgi:hypothetical protein